MSKKTYTKTRKEAQKYLNYSTLKNRFSKIKKEVQKLCNENNQEDYENSNNKTQLILRKYRK